MVKIKICGITNKDDAILAAQLGASALGFIFYKKSPRYVSPFKVRKMIEELPPFVVPVGVFVNQNEGEVRDIVNFCGISTIQFHGDETPQYCRRFSKYKVIKAFRLKEDFDWKILTEYKTVSAYLFDTYQEDQYGGSGKTFNWDFLKGRKFDKPIILAGGLNPQNIFCAIETVNPYAVDVSSGVENSPGIKDENLLTELFHRIENEGSD